MCLLIAGDAYGTNFFAERYEGYPFDFLAQKALGGPRGKGEWLGSVDVCLLGNSGSIDLGFEDEKRIFDGPGADFTILENAFQILDPDTGDPTGLFSAELMFVEVSTDGEIFARFPTLTTNTQPIHASEYDGLDPSQYSGFAGVNPTYANVDLNDINPFDSAVSGGDAFDLSDIADNALVLSGNVDLSDIRWVRLVDIIGDGSVLDSKGNPIYDAYQYENDPDDPEDDDPIPINGADIDALAVINGLDGTVVPEPGTLVLFAVSLPVLLASARSFHNRKTVS